MTRLPRFSGTGYLAVKEALMWIVDGIVRMTRLTRALAELVIWPSEELHVTQDSYARTHIQLNWNAAL